jgi:hypothetical protein
MGIPVVSDQDEFTAHLRDADILLFDKLSSLNRLVQWADNRPVGHCAIWHSGDGLRGGSLFEATRKEKDGVTTSGVVDTALLELLGDTVEDGRGDTVSLVRTVTAMRYRGITDTQRQQVLEFAESTCGNEEFAVPEMVCLAPYAVRRSYAGERRPANEVMAGLMKVFRFYANAFRPPVGQTQRMFCSQLVYRSYLAAGLTVEIVDPLYAFYVEPLPPRGSDGWGYRTRSRGMGEPSWLGSGVPDHSEQDRELADYSRIFEDVVLGPPSVRDGIGERAQSGASQHQTSRTLGDAIRGRQPQLEDMITPGDYWSSPSLEPIVAFHRPPFL